MMYSAGVPATKNFGEDDGLILEPSRPARVVDTQAHRLVPSLPVKAMFVRHDTSLPRGTSRLCPSVLVKGCLVCRSCRWGPSSPSTRSATTYPLAIQRELY